MSDAATLIKARLSAATGVTNIINGRMFLYQAPQAVTLPCVTYFQVTGEIFNSLSGPANLNRERWQIDCWAGRYSEAVTLANAVKTAMLATGTDMETVLISRLSQFEEEEGLHRVILDMAIWFT
jgi:hypothetical protein